MDQALEILKWVGIVLAAGFIGYFGRYLAMIIIARMRRGKTPELPGDTPGSAAPEVSPNDAEDKSYKLEKKRIKVEKKRIKKSDN
jgi:hypothetical protein